MSTVYYDNIGGFSQLKMENSRLYGRLNSGEWTEIETGGEPGEPGADGLSAYVYIAWCSDPSTGANFSLTTPADYIAFLSTNTQLASPQFSQFPHWAKYIGEDGTDGTSTYVYYAYASDADGTNFSLSPADGLNFQAILVTHTALVSPSLADFAGLFYQYKTDLSAYLPLSGGAMTGYEIKRNVTNSYIVLRGGTSSTTGATFAAYGSTAGNPGVFQISAHDGTKSSYFQGYPDGRLLWRNNPVTALPAGTVAGTLYVGASRGFTTIAAALNHIRQSSNGLDKVWNILLDPGEHTLSGTITGLNLSFAPVSGSYSVNCRIVGEVHFVQCYVKLTNLHIGSDVLSTSTASVFFDTTRAEVSGCTFYADASSSTSLTCTYRATALISNCKFHAPNASRTFYSVQVSFGSYLYMRGSANEFIGTPGVTSTQAIRLDYGGFIISSASYPISNYAYGIVCNYGSGYYNAYGTTTMTNVTTASSPASGTVGNNNSYVKI